ncbi:LOW QUALITY PROTEIN: calcium-activated chloride channel regulator 4A-like [Triplophysa dalaica]|uniref:LOW QUALITY PROTEIN: calcium-activated chloride channel regulator 4A-like n=1 Tax=Triplophysa dalaica TaxID=1582913 RepID=UPI0024DF5221|nr:LOW QUALITY PROTEIN: calcium-activated chloride channel regulator 4A-like [Triplophysa dalaica]
MDSRVVVWLWMMLSSTCSGIKLEGNGYTDILVAIGSAVLPQDNRIIDKIKDMFTEGSSYLFEAMEKKVYFKDITILVPAQWNSIDLNKSRTESFEKARIRIDNPASGDDPYTNHYEDCGSESQYIHFTPNFLLDDSFNQIYGLKGRVLVHEWAHLRWGVYDEYNEDKPFYFSNGVQATGCSKHITGQYYDYSSGFPQSCVLDPQTSLPTKECQFFPNKHQNTKSSIMYLPIVDSVVTFCREDDHNGAAPNMQNEKCGNKATWTVIFEDSVDSDALQSLIPLPSPPPAPSFTVVQRMQRVVCLILDVSGSMKGSRIIRQRQAATHFIRHIIEDQGKVGIVTFSTDASTLKALTLIDSDTIRENLISLLPTQADGYTNVCTGLNKALEVLKADNKDALGDEIIFLTDGEATDNINDCSHTAIQSGAIIHTLALGPKAAKELQEMADRTDGKFIIATDDITSNLLVDAFASLTIPTGDYTKEPVQLESTGKRTADWFNGTVSVDSTVGNKTSFLIIYEISAPTVYIQTPSGSNYGQTDMSEDPSAKTLTLKIPGTAASGDWKYSILSGGLQSLTITVTSQAARSDVPPIIVKAHVNQQLISGSKPVIVFAEVSQNYRPVINAEVKATLESETGTKQQLELLDNGAGADAFKNDGIYSRYFTKLVKGRISLKVRVKNKDGQSRFTLHRKSGALYVPGYVVDDKVEMNPPKPPVPEQPLVGGNFSRTSTGESFQVTISNPPIYPPNKITDLNAEIQENTVLLIWTAPGEDLDQGKAKSYEIRWSDDIEMLRLNFSESSLVNTSAVSPKEAGSLEQHSFNMTVENGTTLFFALRSDENDDAISEISNIAQVSKIIMPAPNPAGISNPGLNLNVIIISVCVAVIVVCLIVAVTAWAVKRRNRVDA